MLSIIKYFIAVRNLLLKNYPEDNYYERLKAGSSIIISLMVIAVYLTKATYFILLLPFNLQNYLGLLVGLSVAGLSIYFIFSKMSSIDCIASNSRQKACCAASFEY